MGLFAPVSVAVADAVKVTVLVVEFTEANDAVTPLGSPEAARLTVPLNPLIVVIVMVAFAVPPWLSDIPPAGAALSPTKAGNSTVT